MATLPEAFAIALDLLSAGRLDEAETLCDRILDADPHHAQTLYLAGIVNAQRGRFAQAVPLLERAVAAEPDFAAAHLTLAKVRLRLGDGAANRDARRVVALDPGAGPSACEAWDVLGTLAQRAGAADTAIAALRRARRAGSADAALAGRLGLLLHGRGRRLLEENRAAAALDDLADAAALLPFDADLGLAFGTALVDAGRPGEGAAVLRRVLACQPADAAVLHGLGMALRRDGRRVDAVRTFRHAATAAPDDPDPCEALAALFDGEDVGDALRWSTRALAIKLDRSRRSGRELVLFADTGTDSAERTADVVSFSLWGPLEAYCAGAVANARLVPELLPGWRCRFYHDDTVPPHILAELAALGAELVAMPPGTAARQGMLWRFLPSDDPTVRRFLVRDCDSRPTAREVAAVRDWIASGLPFHVLRDHVMHMEPVMGGMWGGTAGLLPPIAPAIDRFLAERSARWNDQHFLAEWLWPRIAGRALVHDGVHREHGRPFPAVPDAPGDTHVGAKLFHLTRLPPPAVPGGAAELLRAEGRDGWLVHPGGDGPVARSLERLGEWLEIETAFCRRFLAPGDTAVDLGAGFGAHALAFARTVGPAGRVLAVEERPTLFDALARTLADNGVGNVDARDAWPVGDDAGGWSGRPALVRAVLDGAGAGGGVGGGGQLDPVLARHRPVLYLRVEADAAAPPVFARLLGLGYRLWWHIAPVFNPGNRLGCTENPFPGLVSVNALALPPGEPVPPVRSLVAIPTPDADWRDASWRLTCDGR